ncbi:MAG: hypothetical protein ACK5Z4_11315 [Planctomyces sp.]
MKYIDVFLTADCLRTAWTLAMDAAEDLYQRESEKAARAAGKPRGGEDPKTRPGQTGGRVGGRLGRAGLGDDPADSPDEPIDIDVIHADRVKIEDFAGMVPDGRGKNLPMDSSRVIATQWLE